jgi:hypothetical protein
MRPNISRATRLLMEYVIPECDCDGINFTPEGVMRYCNVGTQHIQHIFPEVEIPMKLEKPLRIKVYETQRGCSFFEWTHEITVKVQFDSTLIWRAVFHLIGNEVEIVSGKGLFYSFYTADQDGDILSISAGKGDADNLWSVNESEPSEILSKGSLIYVLA